MGLTSRQKLDVVELAYYAVALPLALWLVFKHVHGRHLGWFYLVLLSLLRLIGAGTGYASIKNPSSQSLLEASVICTSIGISPLLLALLGVISRVNDGIRGYGVSKNYGRIIHIPVLLGLVLAIISGTKEFSTDTSTYTTGQHLFEGAVVLYIASFAALAAMCLILYSQKKGVVASELKLLVAAFASLPFIGVRILYSVISAFDHNSTTFSIESTTTAAVIVEAIMSVLMEFIAVAVFIFVGILSSKISRNVVRNGAAMPLQHDEPVVGKGLQGQNGPIQENLAHIPAEETHNSAV